MAGIYLHIPFCKKACHYCDFHFSTGLALRERMVESLLAEVSMRGESEPYGSLDTVYFGGGTPSLLEGHQIKALIDRIDSVWGIASDAEITLEANPDDLSLEKLNELHAAGINRLSIGIQSFDEQQLVAMNRSHNAEQAQHCLDNAKAAGFNNISADLIFALPNLSDTQLIADANRLIAQGIPHLSAYCLTVEEGTALYHMVKKGDITETPDSTAQRQFLLLDKLLTQAGYEHYEVSNYALPGQRSKHNTAYWKGTPYIAIGPSAHGFDGQSRYWNVANNGAYLRDIEAGNLTSETEQLSTMESYNEHIMTGLRKVEGLNAEEINARFDLDWETLYADELRAAITQGWLVKNGTRYQMTPEGWFMSDGVASELFWV